MTKFKRGDYVVWKWANGMGHGMVESVHAERTEITTKGKTIARNGSADNPAVIIKDHNAAQVVKLASELQLAD